MFTEDPSIQPSGQGPKKKKEFQKIFFNENENEIALKRLTLSLSTVRPTDFRKPPREFYYIILVYIVKSTIGYHP